MTTYIFHEGRWSEGDRPLLSAMSHAVWLSSIVFDGARAFEGVTPDLDLHCQRTVSSCRAFEMRPTVAPQEMVEIALEAADQRGLGIVA